MATTTPNYNLRKPDFDDYVNVETDIAQNMDKLDAHAHSGTYVPTRGPVATGVAATDTAAIQAAITALTAGQQLVLQGAYQINDTLTVSTADVSIRLVGSITQTTNLKSVLLVTADRVFLDMARGTVTGTSTGDSSSLPTSYGSAIILKQVKGCKVRGGRYVNCSNPTTGYGAAIWITSSAGCLVENFKIEGGGVGVNTDAFYAASGVLADGGPNHVQDGVIVGAKRGMVCDMTGTYRATSYGDTYARNQIVNAVDEGVTFDDCMNGFISDGNVVDGVTALSGNAHVVQHQCRYGQVIGAVGRNASVGLVVTNAGGGSLPESIDFVGIDMRANRQDGVQLYSVDRLRFLGGALIGNSRDGLLNPTGYFATNVAFLGTTVTDNANYGMDLVDPRSWRWVGGSIYHNGTAASNTYSGVRVARASITPTDLLWSGVSFTGYTSAYTETQKYAVELTTTLGTAIRAEFCNMAGQLTAPTYEAVAMTGWLNSGQAGSQVFNGCTFAFGFALNDAGDVVLGTGTGSKIGTATTQKLGFYNATPIVQPANTTDLRTALINLGLLASGGASPLNLNGGSLTPGKVFSSGSNPTIAVGAGAGSGATASVTGNDTAGVVQLNTGTGTAVGALFTVTFSSTYGSAPKAVVLFPANTAAVQDLAYVGSTATTFSATATNAPAASQSHFWFYVVVG